MSLALTGVSLSRFATTLANTGAENTEPPDIEFSTWELDYGASGVSLEDMCPGDSRTIAITVQNWTEDEDGEHISDYDQKVTLTLATTGNLPFEFTLTKDGGGEIALSRKGEFLYEAAARDFYAGAEQTEAYILTIHWPESDKDYCYKDEIDYLELQLRAVQS